MDTYCTYQWPPGDDTSMGQDLLTLVSNFKPRFGGLVCFCTVNLWQDPRQKTGRICSTDAILKMELETSAVFICKRAGYTKPKTELSLLSFIVVLVSCNKN